MKTLLYAISIVSSAAAAAVLYNVKLCFALYSDAIMERQMPMTAASMFWLDTLHHCHLDRSLPLPYDQYRLGDDQRTGRGTSFSFHFGEDLSHHFLVYASSTSRNLQHLALACYCLFLFKLTNGEKDLCIGLSIDNRYKDELQSVIGLFLTTIPLRCQLDPQWSFHELVEHVEQTIKSTLEYSYFPLERILEQHPKTSNPAFLDISFDFHSTTFQHFSNEVMVSGIPLHRILPAGELSTDEIVIERDFALAMHHDWQTGQLLCTVDASLDVFSVETISMMTKRFHSILHQLFHPNTDNQMTKPLCEFSLMSSAETLLVHSINNTKSSSSSHSSIPHAFVGQVIEHPQKLAVELDEQSLTYAELLHDVQLLSLNLLNVHGVSPGEIICQCVERSLSMVSCRRSSLVLLI